MYSAGHSEKSAAILADAITWFLQRGVSLVALKQGIDGAALYRKEQEYTLHLPPAAGGDTIGAGDSFDAGLQAGWLRGLPLDRCLEIACRCGRSVASTTGGVQGQLTWESALSLT